MNPALAEAEKNTSTVAEDNEQRGFATEASFLFLY